MAFNSIYILITPRFLFPTKSSTLLYGLIGTTVIYPVRHPVYQASSMYQVTLELHISSNKLVSPLAVAQSKDLGVIFSLTPCLSPYANLVSVTFKICFHSEYDKFSTPSLYLYRPSTSSPCRYYYNNLLMCPAFVPGKQPSSKSDHLKLSKFSPRFLVQNSPVLPISLFTISHQAYKTAFPPPPFPTHPCPPLLFSFLCPFISSSCSNKLGVLPFQDLAL